MELIRLTAENLEREHICCAISNNRDCQVAAKKAWLRDRFDEGLVFLRADARGKCFIEYLPAERAWAPIEAAGWMYIDCLWVSGQFKGQGLSTRLLERCIADSRARGMHGLCVLSADKKRPFLSDPKYLAHKGFVVSDSAEPYYRLYCLPFDASAERPRFCEQVRNPRIDAPGFVLYYTHQCPYTAKYAPLAEAAARARGVDFRAILLDTGEKARHAPAPFAAYSLFYNGEFVTNEILSEKKLDQLMAEKLR